MVFGIGDYLGGAEIKPDDQGEVADKNIGCQKDTRLDAMFDAGLK